MAIRNSRAFTLVEMLVVIAILGILAALTVPAIKELGKANVQAGATQQMLDAVARARQLAISHHTKVYMVFVPANFFNLANDKGQNFITGLKTLANFTSATNQAAALMQATNLIPMQLAGYNFLSYGKVGDQPGQHQWAYLSDWRALPDGNFIPAQKFQLQNASLSIPQWQSDYGGQIDTGWMAPANPGIGLFGPYQVNQISGFARFAVPFPTADSPLVDLPCLVFDYQGRLISEVDASGSYHHAYIPLAQGSVAYGMDRDKNPQPTTVIPSDIVEKPPGNSTGIGYNVIDVDPLTGRAQLDQYKMQ